MKEKNNKKKGLFFKVIKKVKISHLIILIALLVANSYAWFIYVNTVSNKIDVHVKSWQIDFFDGSQSVTDYIDIAAEEVFPGMTTFENNVYVHNYGETGAGVSYQVLTANIMGTEYKTVEGKQDAGETLTGDELTSAQIVTMLSTNYPFNISFDLSSDTIPAENGVATFTSTISWAYESGDDELDTEWGVNAYDFIHDNPGEPCIRLEVKIVITQLND